MNVDNRLELSPTDLGILQLNMHGLISKLELLKKLHNENFGEHSPDVLLLCETWMSKNSPQANFPGYNVYETRRTHKRGGGTCVLVKNLLQSRNYTIKHKPLESIEYTLVEVRINSKNYIVGSLYRAPNTDQRCCLKEYNNLLESIVNEKPYGIVLGMDHNLDLLKSSTHIVTQEFIECNAKYDLIPSIN